MNENNGVERIQHDCPYATGFAEDNCFGDGRLCGRCRHDEATAACDNECICGAPFVTTDKMYTECRPGCAERYAVAGKIS